MITGWPWSSQSSLQQKTMQQAVQQVTKKKTGSRLPGPRHCPGWQVAMAQLEVAAVLLQQELLAGVARGHGSPHKLQQQPGPQPAACSVLGCQPCWPWQHRQQQTEQQTSRQQHLQKQEGRGLLVLAGSLHLAQAHSRRLRLQLVVVLGPAAVPAVAVAVVGTTVPVCWAWPPTRCAHSWQTGQQGKPAAALQQTGAAGQLARAVNGAG